MDQRVSLENLANRGSADVRGVQASVYKVSKLPAVPLIGDDVGSADACRVGK